MAGKLKSNENIEEIPQFKPLGKIGGKGKGWKSLLQSNAAKAGMVGVLVLLLALVIAWQLIFSGGSGARPPVGQTPQANTGRENPPPPQPMPQASDTAAPTSPVQRDASPPEQNIQTGAVNNPDQKTATQGNEAQPEQPQNGESQAASPAAAGGADNSSTQPQIPDDITKWNKAHFARARQENNPRLLDAVKYLGDKFPGSDKVAEGLADLLKPPKSTDSSTGYAPAAYAVPGLAETTIYALGKNGSPAARNTLTLILTGKFVTEDDRTAVEAVLKTLMQLPSTDNEDIILKVLTSPEEVRPVAVIQQGTLQPSELRAKALELVKQYASENLCKRLAENLVKKGAEPNDPVSQFLLEDNPTNLGAQLVLYKSEELSPDAKSKLEQYFLNYSSQAIGLTMGIPSGTEGTTASMLGGAWPAGPPSGRDRAPSGSGMPNTGLATIDAARARISDYERARNWQNYYGASRWPQ